MTAPYTPLSRPVPPRRDAGRDPHGLSRERGVSDMSDSWRSVGRKAHPVGLALTPGSPEAPEPEHER